MVSSKEDEKAVESQRVTVVTVFKDFIGIQLFLHVQLHVPFRRNASIGL